jgi:hypothetical protein
MKQLTDEQLKELARIRRLRQAGWMIGIKDADFLLEVIRLLLAERSGMNNAETVRCNLCELTQEETSLSQYECTDGPVYYCADCERSLFASEERGKRD